MFRAWDRTKRCDPVSLRFMDPAGWEPMRERHRRREFGCAECRSDVLFRAGDVRRPHVAHRSVSDCPLSRESAELLAARAALYEWLRRKFGDAVRVEHRPPGVALPRPIDCWVARPEKPPLAYWVFDGGRKTVVREQLRDAEGMGGALWTFVFAGAMLKPVPDEPGRFRLGPTERAFARPSRYDVLYAAGSAGSIRYLDGRTRMLTTIRALRDHEGPVRRGARIDSPLDEVTVLGGTGEFVHPGEHEELTALVLEKRAAAAEERRRAEERAREWSPNEPPRSAWRDRPDGAHLEGPKASCGAVAAQTDSFMPATSPGVARTRPPAPCEMCGRLTPAADQIVYDGGRGTCKCRRCMHGRT
ncbi:MAG: hypothetical protein HMLKMBBP_01329 [Planctomycetes bacterium]|nr:hypothetical protein [Planctomycetota bacterium]